jgi:two-component system LytT family sensor kinase
MDIAINLIIKRKSAPIGVNLGYMKKLRSIYWICQIGGWVSYALTIVLFAYVLEKQLSVMFLERILVSVMLGIIFTHGLRQALVTSKLKPPTPARQWWKIFVMVVFFSFSFSLLSSSAIEIFRLFDPGRELSKLGDNHFVFSIDAIVNSWSTARVTKRLLFSLILDTPIFFVWISIYILWHYIEFTNKEEIKKVKLETLIKELELKTIKSQINPHFIFNALNSIRALVDEDPKRARQAITELSNILRSSIQADKVEVTSLEKELAIVKDYLALEYIRFADRLKIVYEVEDATIHNQLPPMMLQTLVENAIKHGLGKQPGDCIIKIISKFEDHKHVLKVINTGRLQPSESDGFGLQSTRERLNILYGGEALFEIYQCESNQVTAKLAIPIH